MEKSATAAVFCALLLTTFAHDHLKLVRDQHHSHHSKRLHHVNRDQTKPDPANLDALYDVVIGGKDVIAQNNITLNQSAILDQPTGIDAFVSFLTQLAPHLDVGKILNGSVDSSENFFHLVDKLDARNTTFDRFIKVVVKILGVINGNTSTEALITALIDYTSSQTNSSSVDKLWSSAVSDLNNATKSLNLTASHPGLAKLAQDLSNNSWVEKGINLSQIITILLHAGPTSIDAIVSTLVQLSPVVQPQVSIPQLFAQLINFLFVPNGFRVLLNLLPVDLGPLQDLFADGVLNFMAVGFDIAKFFLQLGETYWKVMGDFWQQIPVIGVIFATVNRVLQAVTHGKLVFVELLESDAARPIVEGILNSLRQTSGGNSTGGGNVGNFSAIASSIGGAVANLTQSLGGNGIFANLLPHAGKRAHQHKEHRAKKDKEPPKYTTKKC